MREENTKTLCFAAVQSREVVTIVLCCVGTNIYRALTPAIGSLTPPLLPPFPLPPSVVEYVQATQEAPEAHSTPSASILLCMGQDGYSFPFGAYVREGGRKT
jgi:hypothetical protein